MADFVSFKVDGIEMIPVKRNPTNEDRIEYLRMQEIVREIARADEILRDGEEPPTPVMLKAVYCG